MTSVAVRETYYEVWNNNVEWSPWSVVYRYFRSPDRQRFAGLPMNLSFLVPDGIVSAEVFATELIRYLVWRAGKETRGGHRVLLLRVFTLVST